MVAHARPEPNVLVLEFSRDGEQSIRRGAWGSHQALLFAIEMLVAQRQLLIGDKLTVLAPTADDLAGNVTDDIVS
jgi:hypothetical protein